MTGAKKRSTVWPLRVMMMRVLLIAAVSRTCHAAMKAVELPVHDSDLFWNPPPSSCGTPLAWQELAARCWAPTPRERPPMEEVKRAMEAVGTAGALGM